VVIPYAIELKYFEFRRARSYLRSGAIYSFGKIYCTRALTFTLLLSLF